MRILGIDPGSRLTGYGLVEGAGNRLRHVDNGVIATSSKAPLPERLKLIHDGVSSLIKEYRPEAMAVESVFLAKNAQSALKLGHARAAAIIAGVNAGLPVAEYTALQVKSAVVGYGKAAKTQVQQMVKALLNLPEVSQEDAADALAVAICHFHSRPLNNQLAQLHATGGRCREVRR